jgi:Rrf2 family transcriptional regulator, cysteine metabolism repressor
MRVSAKAEYACIAMVELAANFGDPQPVRLKTIAEAHGIPQRFLVQILLQLKGIGLIVSVRGALGGYQLARRPEKISLVEIIHAIDAPTQARASPERSSSAAVQAVRAVWRKLQAQEQRVLEETTLAELVRHSQQTSVASYQI